MDLGRTATALWLFVVLVVSGVHQVKCEENKQMASMKKLRDHLLKDYDKTVRPVKHHSNTTVVLVGIWPHYLVDLDEVKQAMYVDTWFGLQWKDFRLAWNPSDYDGLDVMRFGDHEIWQPDITVYNSIGGNVDPKQNTHVLVYPSGSVFWVPPATITTYCGLDFKNYPNDQQVCNITIGSWSHDGNAIDLELFMENVEVEYMENTNPTWNVTSVIVRKEVTYYNCCAEPYPSIEFTFRLQRRVVAANSVAFGPVVASMLMTLAMFWLPPHSGKKVLLGGISLVVLVILIVYVASTVKSPAASYIAVSPLISGMFVVTSAIILEVLVITMTSIPDACRSPQFLVPLLSGQISEILCLRKARGRCPVEDRVQLQEDSVQPEKKAMTNEEEWYIVASAADRLLFLVYLVIIVAVHKTA